MKEFPPLRDLEFLIGLEVSCVVLQPYAIDIIFTDNTILAVENILEHVDDGGRVYEFDIQKGFGPVDLHKIVGRGVAEIAREPFLLSIRFDNGNVVKVHSDRGPYESRNFSRPSDVIVF